MIATASGRIRVAGLPTDVLEMPGAADRTPLVLLHEGLGSIALWRQFPGELHRITGRRLIAFSRHGHGRSAPPARTRTPAFFRQEALEVLPALCDELDVHAPVLVGHSDGASIALIHAAHRPVSGLVLLAPHVVVEEVTVQAIEAVRDNYLSGGLRERMKRHHDDPDAAFWGWCGVWLDPAFRDWSLEDVVGHVTAPTLLIQGAEDPFGSLDQLARIEAGVGGPVQRLVLPGGHSPHLEQPSSVLRAVATFLAEEAGLQRHA